MEDLEAKTALQPTDDGINEASLLQFLSELSTLRERDPKTFKRILSSAGVPDEADLKTVDVSSLAQALKESSELREDLKISRKEEVKSIDIIPLPGFTIKTVSLSDKQKVFINVCVHESIFEPGLKKKLNDQNEEVEGWSIPMSIGPSKNDVDHAGIGCIVHDIIVNPKVLEECEDDKTGKHRDFICQLSLQCLEQKFEYQLDRKYKLPRTKYKGTVVSQRVQDRRAMPQIVELSSKASTVKPPTIPSQAQRKAAVAEERPVEVRYLWLAGQVLREVTEFIFSSDYVDPIACLDGNLQTLKIQFTLSSGNTEPISLADLQINVSAFRLKVACSFKDSRCSSDFSSKHRVTGRFKSAFPSGCSLRPRPVSSPSSRTESSPRSLL